VCVCGRVLGGSPPTPQPQTPNPQSPIPNPHYDFKLKIKSIFNSYLNKICNIFLSITIKKNEIKIKKNKSKNEFHPR